MEIEGGHVSPPLPCLVDGFLLYLPPALLPGWRTLVEGRTAIVGMDESEVAIAELPITGWPDSAIETLVDEVSVIVENDTVEEFYLGRSDDLQAREQQHGADDTVALYRTDSTDNAMQVEDALVDTFLEHSKCNNEADHPGGGASEGEIQFVYLALWYDTEAENSSWEEDE